MTTEEARHLGHATRPAVAALRCVTGEDIIAIFRRRVAGEAGIVQRLAARFAVGKVSEPPAARRGVFWSP